MRIKRVLITLNTRWPNIKDYHFPNYPWLLNETRMTIYEYVGHGS